MEAVLQAGNPEEYNSSPNLKAWELGTLVAQSCPTLCDPVDCSPPGSSVHGISQARILEWGAIIQVIFPTQGLNPGLLHYRQIPFCLSQQRSPKNQGSQLFKSQSKGKNQEHWSPRVENVCSHSSREQICPLPFCSIQALSRVDDAASVIRVRPPSLFTLWFKH